MDQFLCRLCLNVTCEQYYQLYDDCDVIHKIRSCLTFAIPIIEVFPSRACRICVNKIEEINEFCTLIKESQKKLQQHLENDSLQDYYLSITKLPAKDEKSIHKLEDEKIRSNDTLQEIKNNATLSDRLIETKTNNVNNINIEEDIIKEEVQINNFFNDSINNSDDGENITITKNGTKTHMKKTVKKELQKSKLCVSQNYNCMTCDNVYDSYNKLSEHYKEDHTKNNIQSTELTYTKCVTNGRTMYKCEHCGKLYLRQFLQRHVLSHSNERPYVCKICARTYKTVADIIRHGFRSHSGLKLYCSYKCGFSTGYPNSLKEHENNKHKHTHKYTCEKCGKGFQVKTWYDQHQNIHSGLKPFVCDICGAAFHMHKYLTTHRSNLHPQSLSRNNFACLQCDLKCDSINTLAKHMESEHEVKRDKIRSKKNLRKCLCDFCGKILNRPEQLVLHRRMHSGLKPYKCSICHKSFARKFSRAVHERAHAAPRAHACACGRRYSQPSALRRHQRLHHGLAHKRQR